MKVSLEESCFRIALPASTAGIVSIPAVSKGIPLSVDSMVEVFGAGLGVSGSVETARL